MENSRYWVVACPYCGRLLLYDSVRNGKKKIKRCVYCGKYFTIIREDTPSWEIIVAKFDNPKEASEFIRKNKFINKLLFS